MDCRPHLRGLGGRSESDGRCTLRFYYSSQCTINQDAFSATCTRGIKASMKRKLGFV